MVKRVAERRMFSKTIIDSDLFLDMSLSTQALYFHLSMRADDDGFVNNPKKIQRMIGAGDDELKMLIAKQFIIPFESGICVIKHWRIHNFIRNDRYKQTLYTDELARLELTKSKDYELRKNIGIPSDNQMDTNGIPTVDKRDTQVSIELGKDRIGKDSLSSSSRTNEEELLEILRICQKLSFKLKKVDAKDFINIYGVQKVKQALITISHSSSNISSPAAYLAATLQDLGREKTVNVNITKNNAKQLRFQNHDQRNVDYDAMEDELLSWPDDE